MKTSELIKLIHQDTEISTKDIKEVLQSFSKYICTGILSQEEVQVNNLGKLSLRKTKPRVVQNFKTKKRYISKPVFKIQYEPSKTVQYFINKLNERLKLSNEDN